MTEARIYRPSKPATQSGRRTTKQWILEVENPGPHFREPLMGWTGVVGTRGQIRLRFASLDEAKAYAERHGLRYHVLPAHEPRRILKSYADNFR